MASKSTNSVVVSFRSPWPLAWWGIALVLTTLILCLGSYFLGAWVTAGQYESPNYKRLVSRIQTLDEDVVGLKQRNLELELAHNMSFTKEQELQQLLRDAYLDKELLQRELALYRDIMAPSERKGIQVTSFELYPAEPAGVYHYRLILTQNGQERKLIRGKTEVYIYGQHAGQPKRFALSDLGGVESQPIPVRFRYFQQLEGELRLPQDFIPNEVKVVAYPSRQNAKRVSREFPWSVKG